MVLDPRYGVAKGERCENDMKTRTSWMLPVLLAPALALGCKDTSPQAGKEQAKAKQADKTPDKTPDKTDEAVVEPQPKAASADSDADCQADPAWLSNPSQPDGSAFVATSNCSFHRWSYQTFLWLVSKDPSSPTGSLVFEGFANPKDLFVPGGPQQAYPGHEPGQTPSMLARMAKSQTSADIEDIFQAGPGNKALIDQAGNIIYYANHLDQQFWDFGVNEKLFDVAVLQKIDPALNFPVDALELKSSWRIAEIVGEDPIIPDAASHFYVVETEVPTVAPDKKGILREDKNKMIKVKMALIGMHVTGIVEGHPEFIWGTFEHVDNAPNCADIPPTGDKTWNLYNSEAPANACNQFNVGDPMAVVNVCLTHPLGGGNEGNQSAIKTLEAHVKELEGDSLWSNYVLGGGVWTSGQVPLNNGAFSPADSDAKATQLGSIDLANTTMETFTQDQNCFACHNGGAHEVVIADQGTEINAKNINLSHFVVNYQAKQQVAPADAAAHPETAPAKGK